ncbi:hypothetical protein R3P93_23325 [Rhodococcus cerastii]|uniref:Integral membrane protein n=1 Tax=Rhodococcus cerastii TaxID=908616 RepID=A0ABU4D728_9NOCA|nr:hypothetical protein [Rhodococcus cerastii]MDV6305508.1 hypothetical protein [Rhodococcus cerastii]
MTELHNRGPSNDDFAREFAQLQNGTVPAPAPAKIPTSEKVTSCLGMGPIPLGQLVGTGAVVREYGRLPKLPTGKELTLMERKILSVPITAAEDSLEKAARGPIAGSISLIKKIFARINQIDRYIELRGERVLVGPNHERLTPDQAQTKHDELRGVIDGAHRNGATGHYRDRHRNTKTEKVFVALDFPIFLFLTMGLLNANLVLAFTGDVGQIIKMAIAAVFAVLGTLAFTWITRHTGRRHRRFKTTDATVDRTGATFKRILAERVGLGALVSIAAIVMMLRIIHDGNAAGAPVYVMIPLAIFFALIIGGSGYVNYMSEYENGSETTEQLDAVTAQLTHRANDIENHQAERAELVEQAGLKLADLGRQITDATEHARLVVTRSTADKAITIARSYVGRQDPLPAPSFQVDSFDLAVAQGRQLADHHQLLVAGQDTTDHADSDAPKAVAHFTSKEN